MQQSFFLYVRKSTDSEERQILSIEAQLTELKQFAEKEKLIIKKIFTESQSAKIPGRPIFNEMISLMEKGEANGIIAWHPDRLARNSVDGGRIVWLLDTKHIEHLKFPTFWFENTPQGKFMLNIAFGQSKYYVDNLSENIRRGIRQKLRRGEWPNKPPLGYIVDKNLRKIILDPEKAAHVIKLFHTYATGKYNLEELKKLSHQWGLVSSTNKPLAKNLLQHTLKNHFYYGLMMYNGEAHQGTHQTLITKAVFDRVQDAMKGRSHHKVHHKLKFPLLGLAHCQTCGCAITAERQKGHNYYRCTKKKGPCAEPYVREEFLAEQISKAISNVALPSNTFDYLLKQIESEKQASSQAIAQESDVIKQSTHDTNLKLQRLLDAHLEGFLEKLEFQQKKQELLARKIGLEEKLGKLNQGAMAWLEPCTNFFKAAHQAHQLAESQNLESQKNFLKNVGSNFHITARQLTFARGEPWSFVEKFNNGFNQLSVNSPPAKRQRPPAAGDKNSQNARQLEEGFRD